MNYLELAGDIGFLKQEIMEQGAGMDGCREPTPQSEPRRPTRAKEGPQRFIYTLNNSLPSPASVVELGTCPVDTASIALKMGLGHDGVVTYPTGNWIGNLWSVRECRLCIPYESCSESNVFKSFLCPLGA